MTELFDVSRPVDLDSDVRGLPIFVGFTAADEKIVLFCYSHNEFHLQIPNGEVWAMGPDSEFEYSASVIEGTQLLRVWSPMWSGAAMGNRAMLVAEPRRRYPGTSGVGWPD